MKNNKTFCDKKGFFSVEKGRINLRQMHDLTACLVALKQFISIMWIVFSVLILILSLGALHQFGNARFYREFRKDVSWNMVDTSVELLVENDASHLPVVVQKYLHYCGVFNKPKPRNIRVEFSGEMRQKG